MFNQYVLILVWIGLMALVQWRFYREEYNELTGEYEWRVTLGFAFLAMLPVIWMAGIRKSFMDTNAYVSEFMAMPDSLADIPHYLMDTITKDRGFYGFSALLKLIIGSSRFWYLTIIALIQGIAVISFFRKYSAGFITSVFLFIASTDYLSWMFNGIRQFMAVVIIISATALMYKKKYIPVIIVILFASLFHQSALIMIPIVIIAQGKAWNQRTLIYIVAILFAITFVGRFTNILDDTLATTQYSNVVSDYKAWNDTGTNFLRVAVYSMPAVLSFWGRKKIQQLDDPIINLCTNMSIVSMGIYLLSAVTSGIFIGRLPIYVSLYGYILLPWELENLFDYGTKKIVRTIMVVGYLIFYYYQNHLIWGII